MIDSYHCSRYNTQTRRLTADMFQHGAEAGRDARAVYDQRRERARRPLRSQGLHRRTCRAGRACTACIWRDETEAELLYVGKARSLRDRVGNYFLASNVDPKVQALVGHIARIEVTLTNSETEALLLEYNLIKEHKPRYNIVLRDDKSFPVHLSTVGTTSIRALVFYRGSRNLPGRYFGPFPSAGAVKETLQSVQKIFRIRNCRDSFFENRSRPCLQHQIGRCSAPCVKLISREDYARDIAAAVKVLEGRNDEVYSELARAMEQAAEALQYERAAALRDQLAALKQVQAQQIVTAEGDRDIDVFALVGEPGEFAITVMIIRGGRNLGSTCYFPEGCAGRAGRGAGLVPHAVLRRDAAARRRSS